MLLKDLDKCLTAIQNYIIIVFYEYNLYIFHYDNSLWYFADG